MARAELLLTNASIQSAPDRPAVPGTLAISGGKFVEAAGATAEKTIDCGGRLVTPPLVESHIHLDSVFTDDGRVHGPGSNTSGTLFEGIRLWGEWKKDISKADVIERATRAIHELAGWGVLFVRSHVDVSEASLKLLDALLEVREKVSGLSTLQLVAFPQDGVFAVKRGVELLEEALRRGADVVGGIPHGELTREDGVKSVHITFELAAKYDRLIDIHCDEVDDPQSRFLEVVNARCMSDDNGPRVTASHTTAFGSYDNGYATKLIGRLQQGRPNFVANPLINIHLQGRGDTYPKRRGLTRVPELLAASLNVSLGHDCIQDPWYLLGTGNPMDVAHMAAHCCHLMTLPQVEQCFGGVCWNGATTLSVDSHSLDVGAAANCVVHDATSRFDAVRLRQRPVAVISRGKLRKP